MRSDRLCCGRTSDRALIGIVTIVGWIAWAGFTASVVAELVNAISALPGRSGRKRIHLQLPGLGFGQKFAAILIVSVVTMIATPNMLPTATAEPPRHPIPAVSTIAAPTARSDRDTNLPAGHGRDPEPGHHP